MADTLQQINDRNFTSTVESVHPQDVFMSMGIDRDPTSMNLSIPDNKDIPSLSDAVEGTFKQKFLSTLRGAYKYTERTLTRDPNYDPFSDPQLKARGNDFILAYKDGLSSVSSDEDMANTLKSIDDNQKINQAVSQHPVAGFLSNILASSPEALAMVLPVASGASLFVKAAASAGSGALYMGASGLGEQQLDANVTNKQIFDNSAFGAVLGAGLPLLFHGFSSTQMKAAIDYMGGKLKKPNLGSETGAIDFSSLPESEAQLHGFNAGAASTRLDEFGELPVVPEGLSGKVFQAAQRAEAVLSPEQTARLSESSYMRQWANDTYLSGLTLNKNLEGVATQNNIFTDLEASVSNNQYKFNTELNNIYTKAGGLDDTGLDINGFFGKAVDDMFGGKQTAEGNFVKQFMNKYAARINQEKLLGDNVILDENGNYFPASLSRDKIASNFGGFKDMVRNKLTAKGSPFVEEDVNDLINRLMNPEEQSKFAKNATPSELKEKTMHFTYNEVKDYLPENKIEIMSKYIRDMELESVVRSKYGVGSKEYVNHVTGKVAEDYGILMEKAKGNPDEVARLTKAAARDKMQVQQTFDVLARKFDQPHTAAGVAISSVSRIASMYQAMKYLGLAALANLPDLSNLAGLKNALWLGDEVGKGVEHMGRVLVNKEDAEFMHLTMSEMAPTNAAMELIGADTNGALTSNKTGLEKTANAVDKLQRKFFKYSGFNWFVNTERQLAGSYIGNKIIRAASDLEAGTLKKGTKEFNDLHKFGIDKNNVKTIMDEVRQHSVTKTGVLGNNYTYLNVHNWTPSVGLDFTSKLLKEVENAISAKTAGDAPFWTNHTWSKIFTQFKGWQLGALNRQILPLVQGWGMGKEYKALLLSRIIANMCWANGMSAVYNIASGNPEKNQFDSGHMLYNGFNRGNLFPIVADLSNMADSYGAGVGSALGVNNSSRYYNTDFWGKLSPSLGLPNEFIRAGHSVHKILTGQATAADYRIGIRMLPGSNYPIIGGLVNQIGKNP